MKYIDLFAGIGGFRLGIEKALQHKPEWERTVRERISQRGDISSSNGGKGESKPLSAKRHRVLNGECVYTNEWDKYAADIYEKRFNTKIDRSDITTVDADRIPDHDLLCGGFPCQAFSVAGKRRGFEDTRGTLFFDIARILKAKRPTYLLLENVKGLLSHDNNRTFQTILWSLDELGYDLQWQVLNSKNFGVPQNRERVFIIGHLRGERRPEVFPLQPEVKQTAQSRDMAGTLQADYFKGDRTGGYVIKTEQLNQPKHSNDRVYGTGGVSPTLNTAQGGNRQPFIDTGLIRRLTPIECERLQGFPDNWTEGLSDTQRYKTLGNAVTVNVVEYIISKMFDKTP